MKRNLFKALTLVAFAGVLHTQSIGQDMADKNKISDDDEIIILKKGDKGSKVTVEMKNGEVKVNGKPLSEFNDDNMIIRKRRSSDLAETLTAPRSPFRGGAWNFNNEELLKMRSNMDARINRGFLGVMSVKDEKGARITSVTKESAADKGGMKVGDIITKVDDATVASPEELTKAIAKFKPDEKVSITYQRDKKEMKSTITLGKRTGSQTFTENFNYNKDFNFDLNSDLGPLNSMIRGGSPRLGIKAQDTEDGKGVKVLDVDNDSNAEKAGIKDGDVITDFDGKAVNSASELADAARAAKDKNSIRVKLSRDGKSREMEIKVPKKLKTATL